MTHRGGRLVTAAKLRRKGRVQGRAEGGRAGVERLRALEVQRHPRVADAHVGRSVAAWAQAQTCLYWLPRGCDVRRMCGRGLRSGAAMRHWQ
jgi:hypothetical protein